MHYHSYVKSAGQIIEQYKGEENFASYIKRHFSGNKKFGSRDRKHISHLCYSYFRMGHCMMDLKVEERMLVGLFLCSSQPNEILETLKPEWNMKTSWDIADKWSLFNPEGSIEEVFPWRKELSDDIENLKFSLSFFIQPLLYLRLRPGMADLVMDKLVRAKVPFEVIQTDCLALPNMSKVHDLIELNKEAVIQDYSSQRVKEFFPINTSKTSLNVWDCCAASGGKSILLYDLDPAIQLTVSDIRENILANLKKRFREAGIKRYSSKVVDLTNSFTLAIDNSPFDLVIADVPCSGSGTWSRTPEQLHFFKENTIDSYATLQKKILTSIIPHLKPGGHLMYITCSVFRKENEEQVAFLKENFHLNNVKMEILKGYDKKADTLFAALLQKPL